jgi:shikimate dehydrogenase
MPLYGLLGYPLSASFSQQYFLEKFRQGNIGDAYYVNFPLVDIRELPVFLKANPTIAGLNVTIPHKEAVIPYLDDMDEVVKACGACNCIRISQGKLIGFNTDVLGFERSWEMHLKDHHQKALVLGTGGSSKAVHYVLKKRGITALSVSRTPQPERNIIGYDGLTEEIMQAHTLIIQTTPLGMYPDVNSFPPIPYHWISPLHYCFDLVYNPEKTAFLIRAEDQGAITKNGADMLSIQAEAGWEIWQQP